jgi:hypothetical protein
VGQVCEVGLRSALKTISTSKLSFEAFSFYLPKFLFVCGLVGWNDEGEAAATMRFESSVFSIYHVCFACYFVKCFIDVHSPVLGALQRT